MAGSAGALAGGPAGGIAEGLLRGTFRSALTACSVTGVSATDIVDGTETAHERFDVTSIDSRSSAARSTTYSVLSAP
ncbi:MAG: hypothetical protein ACRDRV_05790 [Pseudonocardiaceae bacterium]